MGTEHSGLHAPAAHGVPYLTPPGPGWRACAQGDEAFQCEVCRERTPATKRLRLHRLPRVLLLHIKRFKYNGTTREKLTTNVTYPLKARAPPLGCSFCPFPHAGFRYLCSASAGPACRTQECAHLLKGGSW